MRSASHQTLLVLLLVALCITCAPSLTEANASLNVTAPNDAAPVDEPLVERKLTGRFVHLTDMHPDSFYLYNSSEAGACHTERPHKGDRAGYWGTAVSDCDAPLNLVNATFDWLEENFKGKLDFVVWTGDNARHDIDNRFPRSQPEIFKLNRFIANRIRQTFGNIPVVTSFGNNDIFPHNIMFGGPSATTNEFLSIWKHFIPETHLHTFARGGYYSVEAIPRQLTLISLNTLYFFTNNKAVDGCPSFSTSSLDTIYPMKKNDDDPGTEQLQWLEQQLVLARLQGMQVWLTGHVPATKSNWYEGCYNRYGELMISFQDTIVGQLFGHMNLDHFSFIQAKDVLPPKRKKRKGKKILQDEEEEEEISAGAYTQQPGMSIQQSTPSVMQDLFDQFHSLSPKGHAHERDFSVVHINPSVIPTYLPAVRIWHYNTSQETKFTQQGWATVEDILGQDDEAAGESIWEGEERVPTEIKFSLVAHFSRLISSWRNSIVIRSEFESITLTKKKRKHKKHGKAKPRKRLPRYSSTDSPARSNKFLTPLGYDQFYMKLDSINDFQGYGSADLLAKGGERPRPQFELEYTTLPNAELQADLAPYQLKDGTIASWLDLARRVGKGGKEWKGYKKRMVVSSGAEGEE